VISIVSESVAEVSMKLLEREAGVRLPRQHQQRIDVFLGASLGPLARLFCHEHDRTHEFVLPVFVSFEWGREKRAIGITVLRIPGRAWESQCEREPPCAPSKVRKWSWAGLVHGPSRSPGVRGPDLET
jgi:hypothetical protein